MLLQLRREPQGWVGSFPKSLRVHYRISLLGNPVTMQVEPSSGFRISTVFGLPAARDIFSCHERYRFRFVCARSLLHNSSDRITERFYNNIVNSIDRTYSETSLLHCISTSHEDFFSCFLLKYFLRKLSTLTLIVFRRIVKLKAFLL